MIDFFNLAFGLVGLIGTVFSIFIYLRNKKELRYAVKNKKIITANNVISDMTVLYGSKPVDNLSVTTIACWNSGVSRITKGDFNNEIPIKIYSNTNIELLGIQTETTYKEKYIRLKTTPQKEKQDTVLSYSISFDILAHKQGFVISIIHTGNSDRDIRIDSDAIDFRITKIGNYLTSKLQDKILLISVFVTQVLMALIFMIALITGFINNTFEPKEWFFYWTCFSLSVFGVGIYTFAFIRSRIIPKRFRKYLR